MKGTVASVWRRWDDTRILNHQP